MKLALILASSAAVALTGVPAQAATTFNDLAAWQAAAGSFNRDTSYGSDFTDISSLTLDDGTQIGFGSTLNIRTIGASWATWSGGYLGQVLYSNGATGISGTLSPTGGFGFFIESDPFGIYDFTLGLSDGSTVTGSYQGDSGAGFLGFVGNGITNFTVSSTVGFAMGDFYTTSPLSEPATWAMMLLGFAAVGAAMRGRKRQQPRVSYAF